MEPLTDIVAALAAVPDDELLALRTACASVPALVPGLLAWLEAAVDWALNARGGFHYELFGPHAAIDEYEAGPSLVALAVLSAKFGAGTPIAGFFEATAAALRADPDSAPTTVH